MMMETLVQKTQPTDILEGMGVKYVHLQHDILTLLFVLFGFPTTTKRTDVKIQKKKTLTPLKQFGRSMVG